MGQGLFRNTGKRDSPQTRKEDNDERGHQNGYKKATKSVVISEIVETIVDK